MVEVLTNRFTNRSYHFIGIGGIGVSAVARVLHQRGAQVQGSDVRESQLTLAMRSLGAKVYIGHDPSYVQNVDVVVYSTAVPKDNIELVEAKRLGIPCLHRSEALDLCLTGVETVGVTGTHGKGTVSAMITHGLIVAERDPTFIIGGLLNQYGVNARVGKLPEHIHKTTQPYIHTTTQQPKRATTQPRTQTRNLLSCSVWLHGYIDARIHLSISPNRKPIHSPRVTYCHNC